MKLSNLFDVTGLAKILVGDSLDGIKSELKEIDAILSGKDDTLKKMTEDIKNAESLKIKAQLILQQKDYISNLVLRKKELLKRLKELPKEVKSNIEKQIKEAQIFCDEVENAGSLVIASVKGWITTVAGIITCAVTVTSAPAAVPMASNLKQNVSATKQTLIQARAAIINLKDKLSLVLSAAEKNPVLKKALDAINLLEKVIDAALKAINALDKVLKKLPV